MRFTKTLKHRSRSNPTFIALKLGLILSITLYPFFAINALAGSQSSPTSSINSSDWIWTSQSSGTNVILGDVNCPNSTTCFAMGTGSTILKYNGTAWSTQNSNTTKNLARLTCSSPINCVAVGELGTILKYNGTIWSPLVPASTDYLFGVQCINDTNCFAVGENGTVVSTNDGVTWTRQTNVNLSNSYYIHAIFCVSTTSCIATGLNGLIIKFNGTTWVQQISGTTKYLTHLYCPSETNCITVGGQPDNVILHYNGTSWSPMVSNTDQTLWGLTCTSQANCIASGDYGTIVRFDGTAWTLQNTGINTTMGGVGCQSLLGCFAVGFDGTILNATPNKVTQSQDSGDGLTPYSLSYALYHPVENWPIYFKLPGTLIKITVYGKLPPVPSGAIIQADCPDGPGIILDGSGTNSSTNGLELNGNVQLTGLRIAHFGGVQLKTIQPGNKLNCVVLDSKKNI